MATRDLSDMFTLSHRTCGPCSSGVHIRQTTGVHVTNTKYIITIQSVIIILTTIYKQTGFLLQYTFLQYV